MKPNIHSPFLHILTVCLMTFCTPAYATSEEILLDVSQHRDFEVMFHRASSTATGAVIAGLVGAAIESSVHASADTKKRKKVEEHISDPNCRNNLVYSLSKKLEDTGFVIADSAALSKKARKKVLTLKVRVQKCGFKKTDSSTNVISSFVRAKVQLKRGNKKIDDLGKTVYVLGKKQYSFEALLDSGDNVQEELTSVLKRTGKKIANKIIYRRK